MPVLRKSKLQLGEVVRISPTKGGKHGGRTGCIVWISDIDQPNESRSYTVKLYNRSGEDEIVELPPAGLVTNRWRTLSIPL